MKQMNETCIKPRFYNFMKSIKFSSYYHNQIEFSSKANKSKTAIFVYIKAKKTLQLLDQICAHKKHQQFSSLDNEVQVRSVHIQ